MKSFEYLRENCIYTIYCGKYRQIKKLSKNLKKVLTKGSGCGIIIRRSEKEGGKRTLKIKQRQ